MTLRIYADFIEREYRRLFISPWCPKHGRLDKHGQPVVTRDVVRGAVREVICPKCHQIVQGGTR